MCSDIFLEEAPVVRFLIVSDHWHLPYATTKSLHFGWLLTEGSTVFHFCYHRHRNHEKKDQAVCLLLHLQAWFPFSLVLLIRCSCFFFGQAPSSLYPHDRVFTPLKSRLYNTNCWKGRRANTLRTRTFLWLSHLQVSEPSWEVRRL